MNKKKYEEGDYNCDKCNKKGSFLSNDWDNDLICGVGEGNLEFFLCPKCLDKFYVRIDKKTNDVIVDL